MILLIVLAALAPGDAPAAGAYCRLSNDAPAQCSYATLAACEDARHASGGACSANPAATADPAAVPQPSAGVSYDFNSPSARRQYSGGYDDIYARASRQRRAAYEANVQAIRAQVSRIQAERDGGGATTPAAAAPVAAMQAPTANPERFECHSPHNAIRYAPAPIAGDLCVDTQGDAAVPAARAD
jgi:hypothetical protein